MRVYNLLAVIVYVKFNAVFENNLKLIPLAGFKNSPSVSEFVRLKCIWFVSH